MAQFIRHVGKHGDRKVAIVFREVPGEPHMCLCIYTELLNQNIHDPLIRCIESDIGQNSADLADALNRSYTVDGKVILQVLHLEGMLKKVQCSQIVVTPGPNQKIRLDELNKMLDEMKLGEEAVKRMQEIDESRGLQDPKDIARRMREQERRAQNADSAPMSDDVLGNNSLAQDRLKQSQRMAAEANGLLAESQRLQAEAYSLDPSLAPKPAKKNTAKTSTVKKSDPTIDALVASVTAPVAKKSGRPKKVATTG